MTDGTFHPDTANPFAAPTAPLDPPVSRKVPFLRPALVPATFCGALGLFGGLMAPLALVILIHTWGRIFDYGPIPEVHPERRFAPTPENLTAALMLLLMGVTGLLGARAWLRGRVGTRMMWTAALLGAMAVLAWFPLFAG